MTPDDLRECTFIGVLNEATQQVTVVQGEFDIGLRIQLSHGHWLVYPRAVLLRTNLMEFRNGRNWGKSPLAGRVERTGASRCPLFTAQKESPMYGAHRARMSRTRRTGLFLAGSSVQLGQHGVDLTMRSLIVLNDNLVAGRCQRASFAVDGNPQDV